MLRFHRRPERGGGMTGGTVDGTQTLTYRYSRVLDGDTRCSCPQCSTHTVIVFKADLSLRCGDKQRKMMTSPRHYQGHVLRSDKAPPYPLKTLNHGLWDPLTLHEVGFRLQSPHDLSSLAAIHSTILGVPHVGHARLICETHPLSLSVFCFNTTHGFYTDIFFKLGKSKTLFISERQKLWVSGLFEAVSSQSNVVFLVCKIKKVQDREQLCCLSTAQDSYFRKGLKMTALPIQTSFVFKYVTY